MSLDAIAIESAALLVIDMQNGFLHEAGTLGLSGVDVGRLSAIVGPVAALVDKFQAAGVPVIWTVQEHFSVDASRARKKLAAHTARRKQVSCLAGSWDAEIVETLKPFAAKTPSFVIRKHRFGAFHETRLEILLRQLGVTTLFVVGTTANACVETSIREAYLRDYDVVAVTDCISGVDPAWEEAARKVWAQYFCVLASSDEVAGWVDAASAPCIVEFAHMLLQVGDIEASRHFYADLAGFTPRNAKPLPDGRPFVPFMQGLALTSGGAGARQIDHMAFRVKDVRTLAARLDAAGVSFFQPLHDGIYGLTIYVADPDGTKVEFYEPGEKL
ncbi:isochorismatase family protein [Rhodoplanes roseus]|uniref:Isochorismatase n=1 Tax=Rhodoplanes roseus TaxID=29409 RepID=A0A327L8T4_9BRAD|nr:isochorismatase family protein [Rhodoplanes roseus]RAI45912.1 isochorismatase [Rhodoplanes roseus]